MCPRVLGTEAAPQILFLCDEILRNTQGPLSLFEAFKLLVKYHSALTNYNSFDTT